MVDPVETVLGGARIEPADLVLLMNAKDDNRWCVVAPAFCPTGGNATATPSPLCADRPDW